MLVLAVIMAALSLTTFAYAVGPTDGAGNTAVNATSTDSDPSTNRGWLEVNGDWYYYNDDGVIVINKWIRDADGIHWCYVGANGKRVTNAWQEDSHGWCYLGADGWMVTDCWVEASKGWCWIDSDGYWVDATKWFKAGDDWFHITSGYRDENKWVQDSHGWCYLGEDGRITTGTKWLKLGDDWYHITSDYRDESLWIEDSHGWCFLGADGKMIANGFGEDSHGWAYLGENGYWVSETKWLQIGEDWYHITNGYRDDNKWMQDSKGWCYLGADGKMVTDGWGEAAKGWCYLDEDGYWVSGTLWVKSNEVWYHITNGYMDQNKWAQDSKGWCYLGDDGKQVKEDWAKASKGWCWIASDGYWVNTTKWLQVGGAWFHISNGYRDESTWVKASKGWCWLDASGVWYDGTKWFKNRGSWFHITSGYRDTNKWVKDSKGWCYLGADGRMLAEGYSEPVDGFTGNVTFEQVNMTLSEAVDKQYALKPWWGNMERRATRAEVQYYLDPMTFSVNDWMFLDLQSYSGVTASELNTYLKSKGTLSGTGSAFVSASQTYKVNEVYLVSHAIHESASGTSKLAKGTKYEKGYFYDPNTGNKVKDKNGNVVKYTKSDGSYYATGTYYNFYGYGAYDSDPYVFGIEAAVNLGWNSPSKAVKGGAEKIAKYYINNSYSQNTLYKMRFNPAAMESGSPTHQYATDIRWAYAQTNYISSIYSQLGGSYNMHYLIPLYN